MINKNTLPMPSRDSLSTPKEAILIPEAFVGQDFDSFLEEEGILDEVTVTAIKRVIAYQLRSAMTSKKLTKREVAKRMGTSRSQLDRILDPHIKTIQLDLIIRAARSAGRKFAITFSD